MIVCCFRKTNDELFVIAFILRLLYFLSNSTHMSYSIARMEGNVVIIIYLRLSSVDINGDDQFTTITSKTVKSPGHCYLPLLLLARLKPLS